MAFGNFGNDFLKGFFGSDNLKDYSHASKTFRDGGYALAPKSKFLYYVKVNFNSIGLPWLASALGTDANQLGILTKTVQLPTFDAQTEVMNQYNRKRIVQTGIEYSPVTLTFHDDGSNLIQRLWYYYYTYYFKDAEYGYTNPAVANPSPLGSQNAPQIDYNARDTYSHDRAANDWGYSGESSGFNKPRFFNDITIYGFHQQNFIAYTLINPVVKSWQHDTYDYSEDSGVMQHEMSIEYETVKYFSGRLSGTTPDQIVSGFADPAHYDTSKSPLSRGGSTASILGQGGLVDSIGSIAGSIGDLASGKGGLDSLLNIASTVGRTKNTFSGRDIGDMIKAEGTAALISGAKAAIQNPSLVTNWFPTPTEQPINNGGTTPLQGPTVSANAVGIPQVTPITQTVNTPTYAATTYGVPPAPTFGPTSGSTIPFTDYAANYGTPVPGDFDE